MAAKKKAAQAGTAAWAAGKTSRPYVQRIAEDEELRGYLLTAYESARKAYGRLTNGKSPAKAVFDDKKLQKDIREAGLQEIPGIGPTRKRALLHHFGTLKAIERASLADLSQVPGINEETARKIHDFFHERTA